MLEEIPDNIYCDLVTTLREKCLQTSLLEMWRYEEDTVRTTTKEEVLEGVNRLVKSPWYGHTTDYTRLLGGVERNERGEVTAARTALMVWTLRSVNNYILVNSFDLLLSPVIFFFYH